MYVHVEQKLLARLRESIEHAFPDADLKPHLASLTLEFPKEKEFGDLSCSAAMKLAGVLRSNPRAIAEAICRQLSDELIDRTEIKGAGFINIFLKADVFFDLLRHVNREGGRFGVQDTQNGRKVLLEFVSANPTGALSVAHARQAAVGDALANILSAVGARVSREYYLNDEGNQINILGQSIGLRYRELTGHTIDFPEDHYQGSYITDLAQQLCDDKGAVRKI